MAQKLIIDADPGIGDAIAIALAIFDPEIDVVAVTATAGCVDGHDATRNVQAIVEQLDPPKWPRLGESDATASRIGRGFGGAMIDPSALNGESGLGDWEFRVADLHNRHESARLMIDIVRTQPYEITLLTLGPLTNVDLACERAPDFLGLLKGLVCLGGSVDGGGDVSAVAEFNVHSNPPAARTVLRSPATKTLVPLDLSSRVVLTFEHFNRLPTDETPAGRFLGELLPFAFRAYHESLGLEGICLHEVVALASLSRPRLFQSEPMAIDVELSGELTRGMTVFDRRGVRQWQTNIDVLREVDTQGVLDYFTQTIHKAGT